MDFYTFFIIYYCFIVPHLYYYYLSYCEMENDDRFTNLMTLKQIFSRLGYRKALILVYCF